MAYSTGTDPSTRKGCNLSCSRCVSGHLGRLGHATSGVPPLSSGGISILREPGLPQIVVVLEAPLAPHGCGTGAHSLILSEGQGDGDNYETFPALQCLRECAWMSLVLPSIVTLFSLPTRGDTIGHMQGCEILAMTSARRMSLGSPDFQVKPSFMVVNQTSG